MSSVAPMVKERVLLVDDEPQVLVALEDLLSDEFIVLKAGDAEQGLRMAESESDLAVILTDQRMPRMGGDEFLSHLEGRSEASRILVTGFADLTAVVRAVNEGRVFAYVSKPWQADDLLSKVHRAADHFRLARELAYERTLLNDLMDNVPDGIYFKDPDLRFQRVNRRFSELLNLDSESIIGRRLSELPDAPIDAASIELEERRVLDSGQPLSDVVRQVRRQGRELWVSESKAGIRTHERGVIGLVGVARDVTLRRAEENRSSRLARVRAVMSGINAAILRTGDEEALIEQACRIAVEAGGLCLATVTELDPETRDVRLLSAAPPALEPGLSNDPGTIDALAGVLESKRPIVIEGMPARAQALLPQTQARNDVRSLAAFPLHSSGAPPRVLSLCSDQRDSFTEEEIALLTEAADNLSFALDHIGKSRRLEFLAYHDGLTKLPNRELLLERTNQQVAACRRDGRLLAVFLLDLGRFRQINEALGRRGGDELLIQVAERLQRVVSDPGTVARFDGNVFAVVPPAVDGESQIAPLLENDILAVFKDPFLIDGTELRVAAHVGVATFPSDGNSAESLLANAEAALKRAKATNQPYLFYAPVMNARVAEQMSLETRLRRAVEREEFLLYYQPKVDLKQGNVVGLEALIRWRDPDSGLIPPGQFIPVLEETGLIREVGAWVIEQATRQYHDWIGTGVTPPRIAVNVSALQLAARDFVERMEKILANYALGGAGIDLEITESVFVHDLDGSIAKLAAARAYGMSVAIDDFGTGYSSLSYLARLPIDSLKIDRSFITNMADDPQSTSIVTTIISLAHALDLTVIAEGVETRQQAQLLRLLKCDQIQGYLISPPLPQDDVVSLLKRRFAPSERPKE